MDSVRDRATKLANLGVLGVTPCPCNPFAQATVVREKMHAAMALKIRHRRNTDPMSEMRERMGPLIEKSPGSKRLQKMRHQEIHEPKKKLNARSKNFSLQSGEAPKDAVNRLRKNKFASDAIERAKKKLGYKEGDAPSDPVKGPRRGALPK